MYKPRILAIAPFEGMRETILTIAKNRQDFEIIVRVGNLEQGVKIIEETPLESYDIIVSRGGTYELIKKSAQKPVVEIQISAYDVLRSIKLAENSDSRFAIMGYRSITQSAETLCKLLNNPIRVVTIDEETDVLDTLKGLQSQSYEMVVSDTIGYVSSEQAGLNAVLITSGSESIEIAIDQSVQIIKHLHNELRFTAMLGTISKKAFDYISILDQHLHSIYQYVHEDIQGSQVQSYLDSFVTTSLDYEEDHMERRSNNYHIKIRRQKIVFQDDTFTAIMATLRDDSYFPKDNGLQLLNINDIQPQSEFLANTDNLSHNSEIKEQIDRYSKLKDPILIEGEPGTGKKAAAFTLFKGGPYSLSTFYSVDCAIISEKSWKFLMDNENSPLYDKGITIYFNGIESLKDDQAQHLLNIVKESNISERIQLIFSYIQNTSNPSSNHFYDSLKRTIHCLTLRMLPLRESKDDIPSITTRYLNQLNASLGKEIVGFEASAMQHLKNYHWPNNLSQFKRIVRQLALNSIEPYIEETAVLKMLKSENVFVVSGNQQGTMLFDVQKTLSEINYDIIQAILNQDGMSQMKAAEQLGISRSTIWRILKSGTTTN